MALPSPRQALHYPPRPRTRCLHALPPAQRRLLAEKIIRHRAGSSRDTQAPFVAWEINPSRLPKPSFLQPSSKPQQFLTIREEEEEEEV